MLLYQQVQRETVVGRKLYSTLQYQLFVLYRLARLVLALPVVSPASEHSILVSYSPTFKLYGGLTLSEIINYQVIIVQTCLLQQ